MYKLISSLLVPPFYFNIKNKIEEWSEKDFSWKLLGWVYNNTTSSETFEALSQCFVVIKGIRRWLRIKVEGRRNIVEKTIEIAKTPEFSSFRRIFETDEQMNRLRWAD